MGTLLAGFLFLPVYDNVVNVPVLSTKAAFVPTLVLAVSLVFDAPRWRRFRPAFLDLVVVAMCAICYASSLSNGLGVYDGLVGTARKFMLWGTPYLLGRVYLGTPAGSKWLTLAVIEAGLVYLPFCLWEIRMSPMLHYQLYGFVPQHTFADTFRHGLYRPSVFLEHGLMAGMFLASASLLSFWSWRTRSVTSVWGIPMGWCCAALVGTTLLSRSYGAILLLAVGMGVLEVTRHLRTPLLILSLMAVPTTYSAVRMTGWSADMLVALSSSFLNVERSASLSFRLMNEDRLLERAAERRWLGWGGWGRNLGPNDEEEAQPQPVTDGMWILALGLNGILGLAALWLFLALPVVALLLRFPARLWPHPGLAPAASLAMCALLWAVDDVLNAMQNPLFPMICGALVSFARLPRHTSIVRLRRGASIPPQRKRRGRAAGRDRSPTLDTPDPESPRAARDGA
ncbi:MAG TPA: hypothetical protein VMU15_16820 [Anaeromyxobacter sp.]|nr:hypothetical protein [Anaeromyxobacter sp.]